MNDRCAMSQPHHNNTNQQSSPAPAPGFYQHQLFISTSFLPAPAFDQHQFYDDKQVKIFQCIHSLTAAADTKSIQQQQQNVLLSYLSAYLLRRNTASNDTNQSLHALEFSSDFDHYKISSSVLQQLNLSYCAVLYLALLYPVPKS